MSLVCEHKGSYPECNWCTKARPQDLIGVFVDMHIFICEIENKTFRYVEAKNETGRL